MFNSFLLFEHFPLKWKIATVISNINKKKSGKDKNNPDIAILTNKSTNLLIKNISKRYTHETAKLFEYCRCKSKILIWV